MAYQICQIVSTSAPVGLCPMGMIDTMKPIRWGVLGCARIADTKVLPAMRASANGVLHAIASRDQARAVDFAQRHGATYGYASYEALLADPAVDAIYLPLATHEHAAWALRCIAAGKPVLVEKPFAGSVAEAETVLTAARSAGVMVGEALMYRFNPIALRMRELIRQGAIGRPRIAQAWFATNPPDTDFRWKPGPGSGVMADIGGYCTGIMRFLLDAEPEVVGAAAEFRQGVDASVAGALRFPGGVLGSFSCTMQAQFCIGYEVQGDSGRLRVDEGGMVAWPGRNFDIERWGPDFALTRENIPDSDHYRLMLEAFAASLCGGPAYPVGPEETLANLRLNQAVLSAARIAAPCAGRTLSAAKAG
jgi:D-xylose 1-dehydrogenase (NADP+, D-xylono-1,5-lactone-forming)